MHPRRLAAPAAALALALCLTACNGDPDPKVEDPPPSSSTPPTIDPVTSAPPTSEPTSEPPADESPEDFIRRFQAASFEMQNSGDSKPYRALTRKCDSCNNLADRVDEIYGGGGRIRAGGGITRNVERIGGSRGVLVVEYAVDANPTSIFNADGELDQRLPGGTARFQLNIERIDGSWKVLRINDLVDR